MQQPHLEIQTAAGRRQLVLSGETLSIGRHKDNHVTVTDDLASRFHCAIQKTAQGYVLRDLGSSNGTRVNGRPIQSVMLNPGDVVEIGQTRLILVLPGATATTTSAPAKTNGGAPTVTPGKARSVAVAPGAVAVTPASRPAPPARARQEVKPVGPVEPPPPSIEIEDAPLDLMAFEALAEPAPVDPDSLELLNEADLVVDDPAEAQPIPMAGDEDVSDYLKKLRELIDALPGPQQRASDIVMLNPRGIPVTQAGGDGPLQTTDLLRMLLLVCLRSKATDLHVEPRADQYLIRLRVDGVLVDAVRLPKEVGTRLAGVVKVAADIDPSQRSIIQEGHFSAQIPLFVGQLPASGRRIDYRISFSPAVHGQKLVLRVLDATTAPLQHTKLGLPEAVEKVLSRAIEQESGMILVCGPTGSGKTSTLYSLIRSLNLRERNVVTIEDPVEIQLEDVTQLPVDESKGSTFSTLLRSVLRQDPDVILVGEIRDAETARIAMQSAITGHLVFSTVHTQDTVGTLFRLLDLGVEPYLLSQGLQVVVAQRLVRQLCPVCKRKRPITSAERAAMGDMADGVNTLCEPRGCPRCLGTGFSGRRAFFELLSVNQKLRETISASPSLEQITETLATAPFERLQQAGYQLVAQGLVSFEEVEKAVGR